MDFWHDSWIRELSISAIVNLDGMFVPNMKVSDVINTSSRDWNLSSIENLVNTQVCEKIRSITVPICENVRDKPIWSGSNDGMVTVKDAYHYINSKSPSYPERNQD